MKSIKILRLLLSIMLFVVVNGRAGARSPEELAWQCAVELEKRDFKAVRSLADSLYDITSEDTLSVAHGYANFYLGTSELFTGSGSNAGVYLQKARFIGEHCGNDSLVGKALNCLGIYEANVNSNHYLAQHYLLLSLDYPGMHGSVYSNLAQIARLQKDSTGMEYARKCYEFGEENGDPYYIYSGLMSLGEFNIELGEYMKADSILQDARKVALDGGYKDVLRLDFLHAVILSHLNETRRSNAILFELHDSIVEKMPIYLAELQLVIGKNFEKERKYDAAIFWYEKALKSSEEQSSNDYTGFIYRQLADSYEAIGDKSRALECMTQAYDIQSKEAQSERARMSRERSLTLEVMEREKEKLKAMQDLRVNRLIAIFMAVLLAIASVAIILVIRSLRKRNRLYQHIVSSNVAMIEETEKYRSRIEELEHCARSKSSGNATVTRKSKSLALFESLQELMVEKQLFRNPLLTREEIMELLNTNSTYLTQCIREHAGMNYSQFVNSFRVKAALELLSDRNCVSKPIRDIAEEAGFNSMTTFYKLFQDSVGLSPASYRKSLQTL